MASRRVIARLPAEDPVRLAVDLPLVGLGEVALLDLLGRPRLGVPSVGFVGHRVFPLLGKPERRALHLVALLLVKGRHGMHLVIAAATCRLSTMASPAGVTRRLPLP